MQIGVKDKKVKKEPIDKDEPVIGEFIVETAIKQEPGAQIKVEIKKEGEDEEDPDLEKKKADKKDDPLRKDPEPKKDDPPEIPSQRKMTLQGRMINQK